MSEEQSKIKAMAPDGNGIVEYGVDGENLQSIAKRAPWKAYDGQLVESVLAEPLAVFRGLRDEDARHEDFNETDSYAYVARPTVRYNNDGESRKPGRGLVFMVCVVDDTIYNWDWVPGVPGTPGHPKGWQTRFNDRVWSKEE